MIQLKKKEEILSEWVSGNSSALQKRKRREKYKDVNAAVFEWFQKARAKSIPLSDPFIQAQALKVAENLGKNDFKASNGSRHQIVWNAVSGESNAVDLDTVTEWKEKLVTIVKGYAMKDIFNGDDTGFFLIESYLQKPM